MIAAFGEKRAALEGPAERGSGGDTPVTPPSGLAASASSRDAGRSPVVVLSWKNPLSCPPDAGITIQRATDAAFTLCLTTFTAGPGETTFADATVAPLTAYWYRVRCECGEGASAWTESVRVITIGRPTP